MPKIENEIRQFLVENFILGDEVDKMGFDESLLENGVIDSTGVLEVVFFVEDKFQIEIDTEEVLPENFDTINRLAAYIRRKQE